MGLFSKIFKGFKSAVKKVVKGVKKVVKKVAKNKVFRVVAAAAMAVAMPHLLPAIGNFVTTTLPSLASNAFGAIGSGIANIGSTIMNGVKTAYSATEPFRGWFSNNFPKTSNMFRSISDTVMEGVNWVTNKIGLGSSPTEVVAEGVGDAVAPSMSERIGQRVADIAEAKVSEGLQNIIQQQQSGQTEPMALEDLEPTMATSFASTPIVTGRTAYGDPLSNEFLSQSTVNMRQDIPYLPDQSFSTGYEEFMNNTVWSFQRQDTVREGVTTSTGFSGPVFN